MIKNLFELKPAIYARCDEIEMLPVLKENKVKCVIYGAGQGGKLLLSLIKRSYNILPDFIVDKNSVEDRIDGIPIITPEEFIKMRLEKFLVLISIDKYYEDNKVREEIDSVIEKAGQGAKYTIYESYNFLQPYNLYWFHYVKENTELFERTYGWLQSNLSRETMIYYLRTIVLGERYAGVTFLEKYKYWGIDSNISKIFELSNEEVLLNVGAARGDTVYEYLKYKNSFKKIIAVEASKKEYQILKRNISFLETNIAKKIQLDNIFLGKEENTIDNLYKNEKITLINMDIEGAELSVLKSAINTIQNDRPILSICVYHKVEDLIEIPNWIKDNTEDYVFELRKYPSSWYGYREQILQQNELVLYAIPREKYRY